MPTEMENYDEFDPDVMAFIRYLGMDEDELWEEVEIAKALLKREGYIVI
jgi:hypothetical protein